MTNAGLRLREAPELNSAITNAFFLCPNSFVLHINYQPKRVLRPLLHIHADQKMNLQNYGSLYKLWACSQGQWERNICQSPMISFFFLVITIGYILREASCLEFLLKHSLSPALDWKSYVQYVDEGAEPVPWTASESIWHLPACSIIIRVRLDQQMILTYLLFKSDVRGRLGDELIFSYNLFSHLASFMTDVQTNCIPCFHDCRPVMPRAQARTILVIFAFLW